MISCRCLGNGLIDFDEFRLMMDGQGESQFEMFNDELLNEAFQIFDRNGDGLINEIELRAVMSNLGKATRAARQNNHLETAFIQARN